MSASLPSPPGAPSAPVLKTSSSPRTPGFRYPRIRRQALHVAARLPAGRERRRRRPGDQRLQALLGAGIALVVEAVELESLHQARDVLLRRQRARLVGAADDLGHHQGRENAQDHDHHHHFEQCKAALHPHLRAPDRNYALTPHCAVRHRTYRALPPP
jgi:hypothetical protein